MALKSTEPRVIMLTDVREQSTIFAAVCLSTETWQNIETLMSKVRMRIASMVAALQESSIARYGNQTN